MKKPPLRQRFKIWMELLWSFFKIGLLTFGGGYAMIPMIQSEVVEKKKWITLAEALDIFAVAEATPGPIAINTSTYVGYKVGGIPGALFATLGAIIPSLVIILVISYFYELFMSVTVIFNMFQGLKVAVILLLLIAVYTLYKAMPHNWLSTTMFVIAFVLMTVLTWFEWTFSFISLVFIVAGIIIGVLGEVIKARKEKKEK